MTYREALDITSSYRRIYPQSSYTGHDWDDVLGMYYAKARFYSAEDKRFVAVDPILDASQYDMKEHIKTPLQLAQYVYCKDNPLRWVDPTGMVVTPANVVGAIIGAIGGYVVGEAIANYFDLQGCARALAVAGGTGLMTVVGWFAGPAIYEAIKPIVIQAIITGQIFLKEAQKWALESLGIAQKYIDQALRIIDVNTVKFSGTVLNHLNTDRTIPVQVLIEAIKSGQAVPDPQGTSAVMYYADLWYNGKEYTLEVLVDWAEKKILHYLFR